MTVQCRFFSPAEFHVRENERRDFVEQHRQKTGKAEWTPELTRLNGEFFPPGSMWFCPWWHDPNNPDDMKEVEEQIRAIRAGVPNHFLSIHYWTTWAHLRPPICVVCPGGGHWCPDQKSNNGDGWTVTGVVPEITCTPSIWVSQGQGPPREYHGWLNAGVFSNPL